MKKIGAFVVFLALAASACLGIDMSLAPGLSVKNLLLYIMVIWIAAEAVLDTRGGGLIFRRIDYMSLHAAMIILILVAGFSTLFCIFVLPYDDYGIRYGVIALKASLIDHYLMLFVFLAAIRDSKEAIWMAKAVLVLMTIVMTLSLIDMFHILDLGIMRPRGDGRLQGPGLGSNEYGPLMAFFLPSTVVFAYLARGRSRALWLFSAFVFLMVLFFSASRGALVGLLGGTFVGVLLSWRYVKARHLVKAVIAVSVVAALAIALLAIQYSDLLYTRFVEQTVATSTFEQTSGRTKIWGDALALMSAAPMTFFVGFGWATFDLMNDWGSHNEYLEYFFDLGIIGLSLAVFIFFAVVYQILSAMRYVSRESRLILMGFLFGYLSILVSIFFNQMAAPWLFIWGQAGVVLRFAVAERSRAAEESDQVGSRETGVISVRLAKNRIAQADM